MSKFLRVSTALSSLLLCSQAIADEQSEDKIEQIIVTGTYAAIKADATANTVTVIDRTEIAKLGKTSLVDVLRSVAGLTVRQFGGAGGVNELYIRGGESNFTLVLIDGVKVNDSTNTRGGGFNFNSLNMESIERVEVIRGTQSAIYGGDALSGVINIITRRAETDAVNQNVFADIGEHSAYRVGYGIRAANDTLSGRVNISTVERGDEIKGSSYENNQVFAGLDWQVSDATHLSWQLRYLEDERHSYTEQSGGDVFAQNDDLELNTSKELSQNVSWQQKLHPLWQSRVDVNLFTRDSVMNSPGIVPFNAVPPNQADTEYTNNEIKWVNTIGTSNKFWLNAGLAFQSEEGTSIGSVFGFLDTSFVLDRQNKAAFIEANYHSENKFTTHLSVRYDDPEGMDTETSFNFGLAVPITNEVKASFNWGKGFKLPSFFALGHPLVGNADLKPERAKNSELRLSYENEKFGTASFALFDNHFSDLIDFDPNLFTNVNRALVDITGVEADWTFNSSETTRIKLFATFMDIDTHERGVVLSGRPKQQYGVNFNWKIRADTAVNLDVRHVGAQFDTSLYTGASVRETLESYELVDLNLTWDMSERISVLLGANNLLNKQYFEAIGFSSPGRSFHIKAAMRF